MKFCHKTKQRKLFEEYRDKKISPVKIPAMKRNPGPVKDNSKNFGNKILTAESLILAQDER